MWLKIYANYNIIYLNFGDEKIVYMSEIKSILVIIITKLKKAKVYPDDEADALINNVKNSNYENLSKYLVSVFDKVVSNSAFFFFVWDFESIARVIRENKKSNDKNNVAFYDSFISFINRNNLNVLLDYRIRYGLNSNGPAESYNVYVESDDYDKLLFGLYSSRCSIYETYTTVNDNINTDIDASIVYSPTFCLNVRSFRTNKDSTVTLNWYDNSGRVANLHENTISGELFKEAFDFSKKNNGYYESAEYAYLRSLYSGTFLDFLNMLELRKKCKISKIERLKKIDDVFVNRKEDVKDGLSKTC